MTGTDRSPSVHRQTRNTQQSLEQILPEISIFQPCRRAPVWDEIRLVQQSVYFSLLGIHVHCKNELTKDTLAFG